MRSARGFTLIEIMIAMAVFAIGSLGLMQLQVIAARSGTAARNATEATALAQALAAKLEVLPFTSALLNDTTTTNNMPLDGTGTYNLQGVGADVDHCVSGGGVTLPAGWVNCTTPHADGTVVGLLSPKEVVGQPGDPVRYYFAWDVQDANLRGDLKAGTFDAKIVVARVLWRDPVLAQMRSEEVLVVVNNPAIARN